MVSHALIGSPTDSSFLVGLPRCGVVVFTTAELHSRKPELRFYAGSCAACGMLEICDGEDL